MFEGMREELHQRNKSLIVVEVDRPEQAQALLGGICRVASRDRNCLRIVQDDGCEPARINAILVQAGIAVSRLTMQHPTLEDFFLELTASPEKEYVAG